MLFSQLPLLIPLLASTAVHAQPQVPLNPVPSSGPRVHLPLGTFEGVSNAQTDIDTFYGLPFASPPLGSLRFRAPQPLSAPHYASNSNSSSSSGSGLTEVVHDATAPKFDCMNQPVQPGGEKATYGWLGLLNGWPLMPTHVPQSEDCLYLNVFRPSAAGAGDKLPVMFWIHGGGFQTGGLSAFDGTPLVSRSMLMGKPVIAVAAAYRLSGWGFMPGQEMQDAGLGNLGLRDQRAALLWVQQHIAAFGGDPEKVVIFGPSAGGISVSFQQLLYGGDSQGTFRGAIMHSGSMLPIGKLSEAQWVFDSITNSVGCASAADKIECLKGIDNGDLASAIAAIPGTLSGYGIRESLAFAGRVDGDVVPDQAQDLYRNGRFAHVPLIIGTCEDEGSLFQFSSYNVTSDAHFREYLQAFAHLSESTIDAVIEQYPSDPKAGVPYGSGDLYNETGQNKRIASFVGDAIFDAPRRFVSQIYRDFELPIWAFLYSHAKPSGMLGSYHTADAASSIMGLKPDIISDQMQHMWIAFANTLDPNAYEAHLGAPYWPRYQHGKRFRYDARLMHFGVDGSNETVVRGDDYRIGPIGVILDNLDQFDV